MDNGKHGIHEVSLTTNRHTYILNLESGYTQNHKTVGVIVRGCRSLTLQSFSTIFQYPARKVGQADCLPGTLLQIVKDDNHASPASPVAYNGTPISTKPIAQTTDANANGSEYYSIVKEWVPKEAAEQETDYVFNVEASATVESFEIFVGRASGYETSTDYQKYLISGPQWVGECKCS